MTDWIFDLDNTLYPANNDVFAQVNVRMRQFVARLLSVDEDEAHHIQKRYFRECGTTLRGLMSYHDLDPQSYLDFVHDIDLSSIAPAPRLKESLDRIDGRKLIFTNASCDHVERVLDRLGLVGCFEGVFDIVDAGFQPKPNLKVYEDLLARYELAAEKCLMVEDMARNLEPAARLGMTCLWVETPSDWAREGSENDYVHHRTDNLENWIISYLDSPETIQKT